MVLIISSHLLYYLPSFILVSFYSIYHQMFSKDFVLAKCVLKIFVGLLKSFSLWALILTKIRLSISKSAQNPAKARPTSGIDVDVVVEFQNLDFYDDSFHLVTSHHISKNSILILLVYLYIVSNLSQVHNPIELVRTPDCLDNKDWVFILFWGGCLPWTVLVVSINQNKYINK